MEKQDTPAKNTVKDTVKNVVKNTTVAASSQDSLQVPVSFHTLKVWQYQALQLRFEHPKMLQKEIAVICARSPSDVCLFFQSNKYKSAVIEYGKERLFNLIPKAFAAIEDVMDHDNAHAKLSAACKILEDTGILSKESITRLFNQINTQINIASFDLKKKSAKELGEMLLNQIKGFQRA